MYSVIQKQIKEELWETKKSWWSSSQSSAERERLAKETEASERLTKEAEGYMLEAAAQELIKQAHV